MYRPSELYVWMDVWLYIIDHDMSKYERGSVNAWQCLIWYIKYALGTHTQIVSFVLYVIKQFTRGWLTKSFNALINTHSFTSQVKINQYYQSAVVKVMVVNNNSMADLRWLALTHIY